jgi:hypothetical protein
VTADGDSCGIPVWDSGQRERCGREMTGRECPRHGRKGTGFARSLAEDYFRRTGQPRDGSLDASYLYQMTVLRDLLSRLEVILDDEGVPPTTAHRVVRGLLYGSPSPFEAELRIQQDERLRDLLAQTVSVDAPSFRAMFADLPPK